MSEYKAPLTTITNIGPHQNADRLQIATVYDFQVVIPSGKYAVGDTVLYMPIDTVVPKELEDFLFPADAKIKLSNSRIKQIRIRQFPSQGMLMSKEDVMEFKKISKLPPVETDMSTVLGLTKYEPPAPSFQGASTGIKSTRDKPLENPLLHKYNGLENIKWYPNLFEKDEEVVIQEKLHGSNVRAAILPTAKPKMKQLKALLKTFPQSYQKLAVLKTALNLLVRIVKGQLNLLPKFEKCYGSNNMELTNRVGYTGYYGEDIYGKVLAKVDAFAKMKENETIFGELIGQGIQKFYDYGHKDEHHFVLFDVKILQEDGSYKWLKPDEVEEYAKERGFTFVPVLYKGPYDKDMAKALTTGDSVYEPKQKIREGIVVKSRENYNHPAMPSAKKAVKWLSEAYLDKDNSDFH